MDETEYCTRRNNVQREREKVVAGIAIVTRLDRQSVWEIRSPQHWMVASALAVPAALEIHALCTCYKVTQSQQSYCGLHRAIVLLPKMSPDIVSVPVIG